MAFPVGLRASLFGVAACLAVAPLPAFAGEGAQGVIEAQGKPAVVDGSQGLTVYVDPQTGAILSEPAPGSVPLNAGPQQDAFNTSSSGLVEVPSAVPGGGVSVNLQGRFQSPLIATVGADGKVRMLHAGEQPKSDVK